MYQNIAFYFRIFYAFNIVLNTKYTGHSIYKSCRIIYDHNTLSCLMLIWKALLVTNSQSLCESFFLTLIRFASAWEWACKHFICVCVSLIWFALMSVMRLPSTNWILFRIQRGLLAFKSFLSVEIYIDFFLLSLDRCQQWAYQISSCLYRLFIINSWFSFGLQIRCSHVI